MPFPILGWAAVALGGAIIAAIASDNDDSSKSSGKSTYKKSIDTEVKKRNVTRRETIQKSVVNATCKMWENQIKVLAKESATLLFSTTKDGFKSSNVNRTLIVNDYTAFLLEEALVKERIQEIRTYLAIGGDVSELKSPEVCLHTVDAKYAKFTEVALREDAFTFINEHLELITLDEAISGVFFDLIAPMITCYQIKSCLNDLDDKLKKYNNLYGEREGMESDNSYNESLDSAITKITADYA
jgi:hypothetical protein